MTKVSANYVRKGWNPRLNFVLIERRNNPTPVQPFRDLVWEHCLDGHHVGLPVEEVIDSNYLEVGAMLIVVALSTRCLPRSVTLAD
jgi:hypothetical protein